MFGRALAAGAWVVMAICDVRSSKVSYHPAQKVVQLGPLALRQLTNFPGLTPIFRFPKDGGEASAKTASKVPPVSSIYRAELITLRLRAIGVREKRQMVLRLRRRCAIHEAPPDWEKAALAVRHPKIGVGGTSESVILETAPSIASRDVALDVSPLQHVGERYVGLEFGDNLCVGRIARKTGVAIEQRDRSKLKREDRLVVSRPNPKSQSPR